MARQTKNIQLDNATELRITNKYGGCDIPILIQTRGNGFEVHYNGKMKVWTF